MYAEAIGKNAIVHNQLTNFVRCQTPTQGANAFPHFFASLCAARTARLNPSFFHEPFCFRYFIAWRLKADLYRREYAEALRERGALAAATAPVVVPSANA